MRVVVIVIIIGTLMIMIYAVHLINIPLPKVSYFDSNLSQVMGKGEKLKIEFPPFIWEERRKIWAKDWVRDPFSFTQSTALLGDMQLQAISIDENGKGLVVINGDIYREGDVVGTYKIVRIGSDYVVVNRGGNNIIIRMEKGEER